jgi:hypothetical protein
VDAERNTIVLEVEGVGRQTCRHDIVRHFEHNARVARAAVLDRSSVNRALARIFSISAAVIPPLSSADLGRLMVSFAASSSE